MQSALTGYFSGGLLLLNAAFWKICSILLRSSFNTLTADPTFRARQRWISLVLFPAVSPPAEFPSSVSCPSLFAAFCGARCPPSPPRLKTVKACRAACSHLHTLSKQEHRGHSILSRHPLATGPSPRAGAEFLSRGQSKPSHPRDSHSRHPPRTSRPNGLPCLPFGSSRSSVVLRRMNLRVEQDSPLFQNMGFTVFPVSPLDSSKTGCSPPGFSATWFASKVLSSWAPWPMEVSSMNIPCRPDSKPALR